MKKFKNICLTIIIVLAALWGTMFLTDYFRCSSFEEPLFVVAKDIVDESGSGTYQGLGYTVKIEKYDHEVYGKVILSIEMKLFGKRIISVIT